MSGYYPPAAFHFSVALQPGGNKSIDNAFAEVSGLDTERDVVQIKEGGENQFVHQVPGRNKPAKLVLKRGMLVSLSTLFEWCKDSLESDLSTPIKPRDMMVYLMDQGGDVLMAWHIGKAWPVKWSLDRFNASENKVAMETLELAYSTIDRMVVKDLGATGTFTP